MSVTRMVRGARPGLTMFTRSTGESLEVLGIQQQLDFKALNPLQNLEKRKKHVVELPDSHSLHVFAHPIIIERRQYFKYPTGDPYDGRRALRRTWNFQVTATNPAQTRKALLKSRPEDWSYQEVAASAGDACRTSRPVDTIDALKHVLGLENHNETSFLRQKFKDLKGRSDIFADLERTRSIFDVSLSGDAEQLVQIIMDTWTAYLGQRQTDFYYCTAVLRSCRSLRGVPAVKQDVLGIIGGETTLLSRAPELLQRIEFADDELKRFIDWKKKYTKRRNAFLRESRENTRRFWRRMRR